MVGYMLDQAVTGRMGASEVIYSEEVATDTARDGSSASPPHPPLATRGEGQGGEPKRAS